MLKIKLDPLTHNYIINLPSVSQIIKLHPKYANDYKDCSDEFLAPYQERGNCFHSRVENYIKNGMDWGCECTRNQIEHNKLFDNFLKWWETYKDNVVDYYCEVSLTNDLYTGTFDFLYKDKEGFWNLLDWKTNAKTQQEKTATQLKLYVILIYENKLVDCIKSLECFNPNENRFIRFDFKKLDKATDNVGWILEKLKEKND